MGQRLLYKTIKNLPEGGRIHEVNMSVFYSGLAEVKEFSSSVERLLLDAEARAIWYKVYPLLTEG
jgi:hypothetical protein